MLPRMASALLMLILAVFVLPSIVGLYAWALLGLTACQSVSDAAIRQVSVQALMTRAGFRFLHHYRVAAAIGGVAWMLLVGATLHWAYGDKYSAEIFAMLPLVLVPVVSAAGAVPLAFLQIQRQWSWLAAAQFGSAITSLAVTLPILLSQRSLLAPTLQLLLSETIILVFIVVRARNLGLSRYESLLSGGHFPRRIFWTAALDGLLGWTQGQSDRLMIGFLASTATLGSYTTAYSASRSVGEAMSVGTANLLRPEMSSLGLADSGRIRVIAEKHLLRAVYSATGVVLITWIGTHFVLRNILSSSWSEALLAIPILALTSIPIVVSWSLTVILVAQGRLSRTIPLRVVGIIMSVGIGLAATIDLSSASWVALSRDVLILVTQAIIIGQAAPRRALVHALTITFALGATLLLIAAFVPGQDFVAL